MLMFVSCAGSNESGESDDDDVADDDASDDDTADDDGDRTYTIDGVQIADPARYIVVAADELLSSVADLIDYRASVGYEVVVKGVSEIESEFADYGKADAIREYLKTVHDPQVDNYLLIVGSAPKIPMPELAGIYSDYFYAEITGDFDSDGDSNLGEWGEDSYDLEPEFHVGRIPLDETERIADVAADTISFEQEEGGNFNKLMLGASHIMFEGDSALLMEIIIQKFVKPAGYEAIRIYEAGTPFPSDYELSREVLKQAWPSEAPRFFLWGSHGSVQRAGDFIYSSDAQHYESQNTPSTVVFSSACYNSSPESHDNLGAALLGRVAAAFIGSTTIAHPGNLGELSLTFISGINEFLAKHSPIGYAIDKTKSDLIEIFFDLSEEYRELCLLDFFGFNLYGDPALKYPNAFD